MFIKRIIAWSIKNPFLVMMCTFFLAIGGFQAFRNLPLDAIPDLSDTQVIVFSEWKGRSPDIVEDQITYPIATTLLSAPNVKTVRAQSMFGMSFVYVIFEDGTDLYWARSRVMEYMNTAASQLPDGVNPRLGPDATGVGWGFQYALVDKTGKNNLAELRSFNDWSLRYWLKAVPGVSDVASVGGFVKQYQITVDPNILLAYDISLEQISKAVQQSNNDVGGRSIEMTGREYMIRGRGYIQSTEDIENTVVGARADGTPILMKSVAQVSLGPEIRRGIADLNGEGEAVGGIVVVRFGENVAEVIERVKTKIEDTRTSFPPGVELVVTYDRSHLIESALETLRHKLFEESLVVAGVCLLFLLHFRSALVAIITLPLAVLIAFIPMYYMNLSANIMSLGGIAIAIGAMVDSAIVMIENAHKKLEHKPEGQSHKAVIIDAAQEVGPSLFFALLIITVSFLPVFILQDQEGKLFKPLAYTKTFPMFFAALLSITLVPLLMSWLVKGKIYPEHKHPVSRFLIAMYEPLARLSLKLRWGVLAVALLILGLTLPVFNGLGSEFMPRLWEGTSMYMPTTVPGISTTSAQHLLQTQDKLLKTIPEVDTVFGKVGRAETATDPAPMSMIETLITFKPESEWREGLTPEDLEREMNEILQLPGVSNGWTMPIKGRIDMLSTGIRTPLGIKIFGPDLKEIETVGKQIESLLKTVPNTRSVFADRSTGGYYLDIYIDRLKAARYGINVKHIEDVIESAMGGKNLTMSIEGRERYTVNLRYARAFRDHPEALHKILVTSPVGPQVPLEQVASVKITQGPPMIKSEDGQLSATIAIDIENIDASSYVEQASEKLKSLALPTGYTYRWSGQYEAMQRVQNQLSWVLPLTLLLIFFLLYLNFSSITEPLIIMLSLPFSLIGAVWILWFYGYNLSVAVWVGIIALAGVAAETGIVMLLYLDEEYKARKEAGELQSREDLFEAVIHGSVMRVRPKLMTVMTTIVGLLPIMWSTEIGSDIMQPIAAPMIGGMVSSTVLTLIVIPCIYMIWKGWHLPHTHQEEGLG